MLCIPEAMQFLSQAKDLLYGFLSVFVEVFQLIPVSVLVRFIHSFLPDVPGHNFYMCLAVRALVQIRTVLTDFRITLVFPVPISVCCAVA